MIENVRTIYQRLMISGKRRNRVLWLLTIALVIVAAAILWRNHVLNDDVCRSAWPVVEIEAGEGLTPDSEFITNFSDILGNYQMFVLKQSAPTGCTGVPQMVLEISKESGPDDGVVVQLRDKATGVILDRERYLPLPTPGYDPELMLAARIAYKLGQPNGTISMEAWQLPWANREAAEEYICLVDYYQKNWGANDEDLQAVYGCLMRYSTKSAHAFVPASFVSLDNFRFAKVNRNFSLEVVLTPEGERAYRRARQMDPTIFLILIAELKEHVTKKPRPETRIKNIIKRITKLYWQDPLTLGAVATICASYLDDDECATELTQLAGHIAPGDNRFTFARTFSNMAQGNGPELVQDRDNLMSFFHFIFALCGWP